MPSRPTTYLNWVPDGSPDKVVRPPQAQLDSGWVPGEPCVSQYLNYALWIQDNWIQFLDQSAATSLSQVSVQTSARIINSGVWQFAATSGNLSWSAAFNIAIPGIPDAANTVAAGNVTLADGQCAYLNLNLPQSVLATATQGSAILTNLQTTQGISVGQAVSGPGVPPGATVQALQAGGTPSVTLSSPATSSQSQQTYAFYAPAALTLQVAVASALAPTKNTALIARRFGDVVAVGLNTAEASLRDGEAKTLRNGGYGFLSFGVAGQAIGDRQAVYMSTGSDGRTAGSIYLCETSVANGAARSQFMGFSINAAAAGATVKVVCGGQLGGFSGLVPGQPYWVDPANPGNLTTSRNLSSGQYAAIAGMALTSAQLLVTPPAVHAAQRPTSQDWSGNLTAAGLGATAGASGILSLLANTSLVPSTANTQDLGTQALPFNQVFAKSLIGTQVFCPLFLTQGGVPHAFSANVVPASNALSLGLDTARWNVGFVTTLATNTITPLSDKTFTLTPTFLPSNPATNNLGSLISPYANAYTSKLHASTGNIVTLRTAAYAASAGLSNGFSVTCATAMPGSTATFPFVYRAPTDGQIMAISATIRYQATFNNTNELQVRMFDPTLSSLVTVLGQGQFAPNSTANVFYGNTFAEGQFAFAAGKQLSFDLRIAGNTNNNPVFMDLTVLITN